MKFRFDHAYTSDQNYTFRKKLERAGFKLVDYMIEHPEKAFCKFLYVGLADDDRLQYLEFVHVGKGGIWKDLAGISYRAAVSLEKFMNTSKFKRLKAVFNHKNYAWKSNSVDRLPGWNFVTFPKLRSNIFTWLTEYEDAPKRRPTKKSEYKHPNRVYKVIGVDLSFNSVDLRLYEGMFGKSNIGNYKLNCGTKVAILNTKKSQIKNLIFATKDLKSLIKKFEWDELTVYDGQPAVRIKNPNKGMWDVLIVQG